MRNTMVFCRAVACLKLIDDVNATMACAITAKQSGIQGSPREAGLRSRDRSMPEEINRRCTDGWCDYLFTTYHVAKFSASQHQRAQTLLERGLRIELQHIAQQARITQRMPDITDPARRILGWRCGGEQFVINRQHLLQGNCMAVTDVIASADNPCLGQGFPIRIRHVPNRDEVPGLLAIAVHGHRQPALDPLRENGQHPGVGRMGVLARSVDVEIAQTDRFQPVAGGVTQQHCFGGQLGGGVGGSWLWDCSFLVGQRRTRAVYGG